MYINSISFNKMTKHKMHALLRWLTRVWNGLQINLIRHLKASSFADKYTCVYCLRQQNTWWRHQMETFSALLAICAGNSPVTCEFPSQRPVTRSFGVFFDLLLNKRLSKQLWRWWFETPSRSLLRHYNSSWNDQFSGPRWIPHTKASDAELWCFL